MNPRAATPADVARRPALVHRAFAAEWFAGRADLAALLGPPPTARALELLANGRRPSPPARWIDDLLLAPGQRRPAADALVVLAGQQPALAGGAALVAHKAATAVALAQLLATRLQREVVPVFLLADEDHDSAEVDHVDVIDDASGVLRRIRCPLRPASAPFWQAAWDEAGLEQALRALAGTTSAGASRLEARLAGLRAAPAPTHVAELLLDAFGGEGLSCVSAHRLTAAAPAVLEAALADPGWARGALADGAARLAAAGLPASFDPDDPRPLLLETRAERRRRLAADDAGAPARWRATPQAFSPHAALRPVVQAAALPVVAQVCGPAELLYLAQARGLHERFGLPAPVLVPRLEATHVPRRLLGALGLRLEDVALDEAGRHAHPLAGAEAALREAAARLAREVAAAEPSLAGRARRWREKAERTARRLAEAPHWRGARAGAFARLAPRGRPQDTVLAWLPDAWRAGRPAAWGRHLAGLCRPLDPPAHVLHVPPEEPADG